MLFISPYPQAWTIVIENEGDSIIWVVFTSGSLAINKVLRNMLIYHVIWPLPEDQS